MKAVFSRLNRRLPVIVSWLSWVPPFIALAVSFHYTVNLPRGDYWKIAAPVAFALHDGDLTIEKLREPERGARVTTTRIVYAGLGSLSGWDHRADTAAIVLFSLLSYFCVRRIVGRTWPEFPLRKACMNLLSSLLIFWLIMGRYWTFSPLIRHALVIACVLGVVMVMSARSSRPLTRVFFSVILACLAASVFLPGWIVWGVLLGMIVLLAWGDRGEWNWGGAGLLAVVALAANIAFYQIGLPENEGLAGGLSETLSFQECVQSFVRWLGTPFSSPPFSVLLEDQGSWQKEVSLVVGAMMLIVTVAVLLAALFRCWRKPEETHWLAPWMALAGFGLAEGAAMASGWGTLAPDQYSFGEHISFSIWVYLAVLGILFCFPRVSAARTAVRIGGLAALPLFLLSYSWGARFGLEQIQKDAAAARHLRAGVQLMPLFMGKGLGIENDVIGQPFAFPLDVLFRKVKAADQAGFLKPQLVAGNLWMEADHRADRELPVIGQFEFIEYKRGDWLASGWAAHSGHRTRVDAVVLTMEIPGGDEKLLGIAQETSARLEFAGKHRVREFRPRMGWIFKAGNKRWTRLVKPDAIVRAYAMDTDQSKLYRLEGEYRHTSEAKEKGRMRIDLSTSPK